MEVDRHVKIRQVHPVVVVEVSVLERRRWRRGIIKGGIGSWNAVVDDVERISRSCHFKLLTFFFFVVVAVVVVFSL